MKKGTTVSPEFQVLVANFSGAYDAQGNPVKTRTEFREQLVYSGKNVNTIGRITGDPAPATATIQVSDNDFSTGRAELVIGDYTLISGEHFTVGGSAALTAQAIAAVIDGLPEFAAPVPGGDTISVSGPLGPDGGTVELEARYYGTIVNYTLTPDTGFFTVGGPTIGPPAIS